MLSRECLDKLIRYCQSSDDDKSNDDKSKCRIISDMNSLLNIRYESRINKIDEIKCFSHVVICKRMKGWDNLFHKNLNSFNNMDNLLKDDIDQIYPRIEDTLKIFEMLEPSDVRVIIIGRDPYPGLSEDGLPYATGIPFSIASHLELTPSLRNISSELRNSSSGDYSLEHGDLSSWVKQGVLLLNRSLTLRKGETGSHDEKWDWLIVMCIDYIIEQRRLANKFQPILALWGSKARSLSSMIKSVKTIITAPHPSAFGDIKFAGCKHFDIINNYLLDNQSSAINWNTRIDLD